MCSSSTFKWSWLNFIAQINVFRARKETTVVLCKMNVRLKWIGKSSFVKYPELSIVKVFFLYNLYFRRYYVDISSDLEVIVRIMVVIGDCNIPCSFDFRWEVLTGPWRSCSSSNVECRKDKYCISIFQMFKELLYFSEWLNYWKVFKSVLLYGKVVLSIFLIS